MTGKKKTECNPTGQTFKKDDFNKPTDLIFCYTNAKI